jgi:hypothetical protein
MKIPAVDDRRSMWARHCARPVRGSLVLAKLTDFPPGLVRPGVWLGVSRAGPGVAKYTLGWRLHFPPLLGIPWPVGNLSGTATASSRSYPFAVSAR